MSYTAPRQFSDIDALVIRAASAHGLAALELSRRFGPDAQGKPILSRQAADKIIKRQSYRLPYRMLPKLRKVFVYRPVLITEHAYPDGNVFTRETVCEWDQANFFEFMKGEPSGGYGDSYIWNEILGCEVISPRFWRWAEQIDETSAPYEADNDADYLAKSSVVALLLGDHIKRLRAARGLPPHKAEPTKRELQAWREYVNERESDERDQQQTRKAALAWRYSPSNPAEIERRRKIRETQRRNVFGDAYIPNYEETIKVPALSADMWAELAANGVNQGPNWTEPPYGLDPGTPVGRKYGMKRGNSFRPLRGRRTV